MRFTIRNSQKANFDFSNANPYGQTLTIAFRSADTGRPEFNQQTARARQIVTRKIVPELVRVYDAPKSKIVHALLTNRLDQLEKLKANVDPDSQMALWIQELEDEDEQRQKEQAQRRRERRAKKQREKHEQEQRAKKRKEAPKMKGERAYA